MDLEARLRTRLVRVLVAGLLAACGDGSDGEAGGPWTRIEDDALDGINFLEAWGIGEDVWAMGQLFDLPISVVVHHDGTRWEALAGGGDLSGDSRSLWATSADDVWLVDPSSPRRWDGVAWAPLDLIDALGGATGRVVSVWGTAPDDMWISVDLDDGDDVALRYDGAGWEVMFTVPIEWEYEYDEPRIGGGCSVSRDEVWVEAAQGGGSETTRTMFRWDGVDWETHRGGGHEPFCAAGQVWVFGRVSDLGGAVASRNDGEGWNRFVEFDEDSWVGFADLWAGDDGDGWIAGWQSDDEYQEWMQIWRISGDEVTPTLDVGSFSGGPEGRWWGDRGAIWQTDSGRVLAFGSDGIVLEYTGPE